MTRIDEKGPPIVLTEDDRERLSELFASQKEVVAAYLFGSQATGKAGPLSDVDLAVWLDPDLARGKRSDCGLRMMSAAASCLGADEVQVVVLNDVPPLLAHRVLRDGNRLVDNDPRRRIGLETRAVLEYLDMEPLRREFARGLAHSLKENRFGRP